MAEFVNINIKSEDSRLCGDELMKMASRLEVDSIDDKLQRERKKYDIMYKNIQRRMRKTRYGRKIV